MCTRTPLELEQEVVLPPEPPAIRPDKAYETKYNAMYSALVNAYEACPEERSGDEDAGEAWIQEKRANLMRNYMLEHTPIGNCIIRFNSEMGVFEYFSDRVIPYRLLESVGKKYVRMFFCKPIYVDLDTALKEAEEKKNKLLADEAEVDAKTGVKSEAQLTQLRHRRLENVKQMMGAKMPALSNKMAKVCEVDPAYRTILETNAIRRGIKNASNSYIHKGPFANFSVQPGQKPDAEKANNSILQSIPYDTEVADADNARASMSFAEFKKKCMMNKYTQLQSQS